VRPRIILAPLKVVSAFLLTGCPASHLHYTWRHATQPACPASFQADVAACMDVRYVPYLWGGGSAITRATIEDCMKKRGYREVGRATEIPEPPVRPSAFTVSRWPWPDSPPTSSWDLAPALRRRAIPRRRVRGPACRRATRHRDQTRVGRARWSDRGAAEAGPLRVPQRGGGPTTAGTVRRLYGGPRLPASRPMIRRPRA
jgi:hypothetical protein